MVYKQYGFYFPKCKYFTEFLPTRKLNISDNISVRKGKMNEKEKMIQERLIQSLIHFKIKSSIGHVFVFF